MTSLLDYRRDALLLAGKYDVVTVSAGICVCVCVCALSSKSQARTVYTELRHRWQAKKRWNIRVFFSTTMKISISGYRLKLIFNATLSNMDQREHTSDICYSLFEFDHCLTGLGLGGQEAIRLGSE